MRPGSLPFRPRPSSPFRGRSPRAGFAPINGLHFVNAPNPAIPPGYFAGTPCYTNPSYSESFYCSQYLHGHNGGFGAAAYAPIYWMVPMDYSAEDETPAAQPEPDNSIADQVQALTDEVEMLREEQSAPQELPAREAGPRASAPKKPPKTVLVFRDGHQSEVQDYAILGKTLWVFGDQTTRKVPLAQLNLDGTIKLNDDRGVDFASPGTL